MQNAIFSRKVKLPLGMALILLFSFSCAGSKHLRLSVPVSEIQLVSRISQKKPTGSQRLSAAGSRGYQVRDIRGVRLMMTDGKSRDIPIPFVVERRIDSLLLRRPFEPGVITVSIQKVKYIQVDCVTPVPMGDLDILAVSLIGILVLAGVFLFGAMTTDSAD